MKKTLEEELTARLETKSHWVVTGGAGFIGSHLVEHLLRHGQKVTVIDNFATGKKQNLENVKQNLGPEVSGNLSVVEGDIRDRALCDEVMGQGIEYVLHQAALGSVPRSFTIPEETHAVNSSGFVTLLEAARRAEELSSSLRAFVYASSSSVYGDHPGLPKVEEELGRVLSPYAASKRTNEIYADAFSSVCPFSMAGLRYFNVFGPRQDPEGPYAAVIPRWIAALKEGKQCTLFGDGKTSRDFCYIDNVVAANIFAALAIGERKQSPIVCNIAAGAQTTLLELHGMIVSALESMEISGIQREIQFEPFREGDVRHSLADISHATKEIGYQPIVHVEEGIAKTVAAFAA